MKRQHFETLRPICPLCHAQHQRLSPLKIGPVICEQANSIIEGILNCADSSCQCEYPIIDGIPVIVPDVRTFIQRHIQHFISREDLSPVMRGLLGDGAGPDSSFDRVRQHLSICAWSHYADFDPHEDKQQMRSLLSIFERGWDDMEPAMKLPCLDVGCSVGRTTFETAQRCPNQLVVGVDLDFNMLRVAQQALATGTVRYDRRRVGLVYDNREFDVPFGGLENVDFWLCDAMHLPFADRSFANVVGLNVLDCVASPLQFLYEVDRTIAADGWFVMSSPFDWSANATPVEAWLGGHSQRGPDGGSSEKMLEQLLTPGKHAQSVRRMRLQKTIDRLPWKVRLHDRFIAEYMVQLLLAKA